MTRAARLAAIEAGRHSYVDMPEELETNSNWTLINRLKLWMIWFLRTHGFLGVLLMASYPNIAFDLCGICCGHFLMPFWTFFGATFLGKAIIRNGYQSIIYVILCTEDYLEKFIQAIEICLPDRFNLDKKVRQVFEEGRDSFRNLDPQKVGTTGPGIAGSGGGLGTGSKKVTAGELIGFWWKIFMASLLCFFFLSCISHFAQYYQLTVDQDDSRKLRKRLPNEIRNDITSPVSGRLKLPPPTPYKSDKKNSSEALKQNK